MLGYGADSAPNPAYMDTLGLVGYGANGAPNPPYIDLSGHWMG